jgi:hypothetical protein
MKLEYLHIVCRTERIHQDLGIEQDAVLRVGPPVFFGTIFCGEGKLLFIVCKVLGREGYQIFDD